MKDLIPQEVTEKKIYLIRGQKVMLDRDLAELYGVETRVLNQAVRRNIERFPDDFIVSLTREEIMNLSQIVISSKIKHAPNVFAFTEQGVAMLSSVIKSQRAIQVNIVIMRAFVKLREILSTHKELVYKLNELERKTEKHDTQIQAIFEAIRQLMTPPEKPKQRIGFYKD
ncbi:MAG: ORF6N domain-containing protein [bacterium]|nr:ORF6N domain-containing protein [bacterium]